MSCSNKTSIVGKWREIGGDNARPEFFKDGTIRAVGSDGRSLGGTYSFVEKDRIKMELSGVGAHAVAVIVRVAISGSELKLTDEQGKVSRYKRVKE